MRARYQHLMEHPKEVETMLLQGAVKARAVATPFMARLREAVGLRGLSAVGSAGKAKAAKAASASIKQYREADGKFYFKLVDAEGKLLMQSLGFDSPKEAGQTIGLLQTQGASALPGLANQLVASTEVEAQSISAALALMLEQD